MSSRNENGETTSIVFEGEDYPAIFKTDYDDYSRIFCSEKFKKTIIDNNLNGLVFQADLASLFIDDGICGHPQAH